MTRILVALLALMLPVLQAQATETLRLITTTSIENSGLTTYLLPRFTADTGITVQVLTMGTGQALKAGERGDGDILITHAPEAEKQFVRDGFGHSRRAFMYNDFLIVGPDSDPAGIAGLSDAGEALRRIHRRGVRFMSRGDNSGTHKKELFLWRQAGIDDYRSEHYRDTGSGMGATLNIAASLDVYTLVDRGTWLSFGNRQDLKSLVEGDPLLFNQYAVTELNKQRHPHVKARAARQLSDWLISERGQAAIAAYRVEGKALFKPNYQNSASP